MNPFEAELAGVHWALTKEHYFTCGSPSITVFCDCEGLGRFLAGDMENLNLKPRLVIWVFVRGQTESHPWKAVT